VPTVTYKILKDNLVVSIAKSPVPGRKLRVLTAVCAVPASKCSTILIAKHELATTKGCSPDSKCYIA